MCLVVDNLAMDSLLNPVEGQDPWVWAVDVEYEDSADGEHVDKEYSGYFKVAISSLVTELWPMLAGPGMSGVELYHTADPIWKYAI